MTDDDSYKSLLAAGYAALRNKLECAEAIHVAALGEFEAAKRLQRGVKAAFLANVVWLLFNTALSLDLYLSQHHGHGARTDQAGVLAGPDTDAGRGAPAERRPDARVYPPGLVMVDR